MKKILTLILAVAMILSVCAVPVFAAEPSLTAVADKTACSKDDIIKVDFVVDGVSNVAAVKVQFKYDTEKLQVWNSKTDAAATKAADVFVQRSDMYDADEETGYWVRRERSFDFEAGTGYYTIGLEATLPEGQTGVPIDGPFTAVTVYFKAIADGQAAIDVIVDPVDRNNTSIVNEIVDGKVKEADIVSSVTTIQIGEGGEQPQPSTVIAKINTEIPEEVESIDQLPEKISVTLDDETVVEVAVTWTKAEDGTITGTVEGYTFAEGVSLTSKLAEQQGGEDEDKVVSGLAGDPIEVESVEQLPEKIKVTVDGETVEIDVTWDTEGVVDGEGTAKAILPDGYKYADGVEITATVKKAEQPEEPEEPSVSETGPILIIATAKRAADAADKIQLDITFARNEDFDGDTKVEDDERVTLIYTLYKIVNGVRVPVSNSVILANTLTLSGMLDFEYLGTELTGDAVSISLVKDFDKAAAISGDNLGTPIAGGVTIEVK